MEKKEKIIIIIVTAIILIGIFMAFLVSNSKKMPPTVLIQNEDGEDVESVLGGYTWKVFGSEVIADSIDLKTIDYSSNNTIISRTGKLLTLSTTDKFSVKEINYINISSKETFDVLKKPNDGSTFFSVYAPENEGTYLCMFKLEYSKGEAEYAVKLVVTDDNIYNVKEIIKYKETDISKVVSVRDILDKLPYNNELNGVTINLIDTPKTLGIKYDNLMVEKEDLLNSSIALFALIPNLDAINYNTKVAEDIYYTRDEVNNFMNRDVLEYAEDAELWLKEVIYREKNLAPNNFITVYTSVISSSLANLSNKEIGKYIAIDINKNNASGDIILNEYGKKELLEKLNEEYENVLLVNANEFQNEEGMLVYVSIGEIVEDNFDVNIRLVNSNGEEKIYNYRASKNNDKIEVQTGIESSGEQE